ncbi:MAG: sensor histidine kinase [Oscillospiraceae bacterium]|nr:sensor histidine kinase [Oscillospiraceae bacterium]
MKYYFKIIKKFFSGKSQLLTSAVYLAITFFVLALIQSFGAGAPNIKEADAAEGIADLRDFDFVSSIARVGGAEFFPGVLLPPEETETALPGVRSVPEKYITARVRLLVPDGEYLIYGKGPDYASRIFVNGKLTGAVGFIDEEDESGNIYQMTQFRSAARPDDGVIEVVFHIAGIIRGDPSYHGLFIGESEPVSSRLIRDTVYGLIPVIIFITCALFYFGYFLFIPSQKANLWFALISLTIGVFASYNWKIGYNIFPEVDYGVEYVGLHVALLLICAFYSLFTQSLFSTSKTVPAAICAGGALLAVSFAALPISVTSRYLLAHTLFVFSVMSANILLIVMKFKQFKTEHTVSFCGQVIFIIGGVLDMFGFRFIDFWDFTNVGMIVFLFTQMTSLYIVNNRTVESEQRLKADYAALEKQSEWKAELLGNLSHELKTPLTVISNVAQLAQLRSSEDYVRTKLDTAVAEVERMKLTVGQILALARLEDNGQPLNFGPVDMKILIKNTLSHYFQALNENNNKLTIEYPESLPEARADAEQVGKVLVNLINNAIRFTRNGNITVGVRHNSIPEDSVLVTVEDAGRGITPEQKERIFERFFTGDRSTGTGLGLYICKKIIDAHGGEISVRSEPGEGTAVSFTLPVWKTE